MGTDLSAQLKAVSDAIEKLPRALASHVARVAEEADALARCWEVDTSRVRLAVLGHDLFRAVPEDQQIPLARSAGVPVRRADRVSPIVLHGPIAAAILKQQFGIDDEEVLEGISQHTLGAARMPMISKILLLADKMEQQKRRRDPAMRAVHQLAYRDLDLALLCWADWKWVEERTHGWESHPAHWRARRAWVQQHHLEIRQGLR